MGKERVKERAPLICKERKFTERSKSLLTHSLNSWKWWSIVKMAAFGASSRLPPLIDRGGKLARPADKKASFFSTPFCTKQCRERFQRIHSCDPSLVLCYVAFRFNFVRNLFLDLDHYGGNNLDGMLVLFYNMWLGIWNLN